MRVRAWGSSLMWIAARMRWVREMPGCLIRGSTEMGEPVWGEWWVWKYVIMRERCWVGRGGIVAVLGEL